MVSLILWILCIFVSVSMIVYVLKYGFDFDFVIKNEGFTTNIEMTACPPSSMSYITGAGDTNCCDGDIVNKQCNGRVICSLSPKPPEGVMSCSDWMNEEWTRRSSTYCPSSMPNYFGSIRRRSGVEGCSESPCTLDGSAPQTATMPSCKIYPSENQDRTNIDSCYNAKNMAALAPPGTKATQIALPISGPMPNCIDTNMLTNQILPAMKPYVPKIADLIEKDPCTLSGVMPICGNSCATPASSSNPTGYVISGTDIEGEIPVQLIKNDKGNNAYLTQNKDRIIIYGNKDNMYSFVGKLSEIGLSNKTEFDQADGHAFNNYINKVVPRYNDTLKKGEYNLRKL